ncbi:MAG: DegT/DnrJ/EryC1/StrS family aminotransferase [Thermodesulfobacteriota bacterium]
MSKESRGEGVYLSPPHMSGLEEEFVREAFQTNWIAPVGPQLEAFEEEFCKKVGVGHALAVVSGTAAIHLAVRLLGVERGDEVVVSTFTFIGSAFPVVYEGGRPVFVDSESTSWNMDPWLLDEVLQQKAKKGKLPKAVILAHIYGQCADVGPILRSCENYGVHLIEDAAEALGSTYGGNSAGTFGDAGIFSFNGNKIITTSGGGMLVSNQGDLIAHARKIATQARDPAPHYQHSEIGYNYRLSNVLAGIGRGQLRVLDRRMEQKRRVFDAYVQGLGDVPGIRFMPEAGWGRSTRWLTVLTVDSEVFGATPEDIRAALEAEAIESRPVWKPMHLQPVFDGCEYYGTGVAERLFEEGLCLPSGTALDGNELGRIIDIVRSVARTH